MASRKLQVRIGGLKICPSCSKLELECSPYVWTLKEHRDELGYVLKPAVFKLFDRFADLRASAKIGCHICLVWHKAIMNECHSVTDEEELLHSQDPVELELPTEVCSPQIFNVIIKIVKPVEASIRIAEKWNSHIGDASIGQDDLAEDLWNDVKSKKLTHCQSNHRSCDLSSTSATLPSRLVHIPNETVVMVCDTAGLPSDLQYAALSYVWGGDQEVILTAEQESSFREGLPQEKFPRTLRDTFTICRKLGISYVWIDALCIRQKDGGQDFLMESERMDKIYGCATITLVMATTKSASEGFLKGRPLEQTFQVNPKRTYFADDKLLIQRKSLMEVRARSPVALRGWCFQEELLSRRLLYCTGHGIFWSCGQGRWAEHGAYGGDFRMPKSVINFLDPHFFLKSSDRLYIWDQLVEQYSVRDLTLREDRLAAVRGLARSIELQTGEEFVFGIWVSRLPVQLLWISLDMRVDAAHLDQTRRVAAKTEVPSWSWASTPPRQAVRMPGSEISYSRAKLIEQYETNRTTCLKLLGRRRILLSDHKRIDHWPVKESTDPAIKPEIEPNDQESKWWAVKESEIQMRQGSQ